MVDEKNRVATNVVAFNTRTKEAEVMVMVLVNDGPNVLCAKDDLQPIIATCPLPGFKVLFKDTDEELVTEEQAADYLSKLEFQSNG